jgi:hyperosmotically inducible periplasmic protein
MKLVRIFLALAVFAAPALARADAAADAALGATVEQAWIADKTVPSYLIAASVRGGKLQLFGAVETAEQRNKAVSIAKGLAGATPVEDHIAVTKIASQVGAPTAAGPSDVPAQDRDMAVAMTVEQAWMSDGKIPYYLIAAKARGGKLQLFGAVETAAQHDAAVAIAKKNAGSLAVVDHIAVAKIASQSPTPK